MNDFRKNLRFLLTKSKSDGYTDKDYEAPISYSAYMHKMLADSIHNRSGLQGRVSSRTDSSRIFRIRSTYLMVLDCDGYHDMSAAVNELCRRKIGYYTIESSPGRFWVISDYEGSFSETVSQMETIPGVDTQYVRCCRLNGDIVLRGIPKFSVLPVFTKPIPKYSKSDTGSFKRWLEMFRDYWYSPEMASVISNVSSYQCLPATQFMFNNHLDYEVEQDPCEVLVETMLSDTE